MLTYVDSEGTGWSINFSGTGGGANGCIRGWFTSSSSVSNKKKWI